MKLMGVFLLFMGFSCASFGWGVVDVFESKSSSSKEISKLSPSVFGMAGMIHLSSNGEKNKKFGVLVVGGQKWNLEFVCNEEMTSLEFVRAESVNGDALNLPAKLFRETTKDIGYTAKLPLELDANGEARRCNVGLYFYLPNEGGLPSEVRYTTDMYLVSRVDIEGVMHDLVLVDMNYDGFFTGEDYWVLRRADIDSPVKPREYRRVNDFNWSDGRAFKIALEGNLPDAAVVTSFHPGITEEQDRINRDSSYADKKAKRALEPLKFYHDFHEAVLEAKKHGKMYFIDFETDWCGPCKKMDRYVYTAKDVVDAAENVISIKVDGDENEELVERYKVSGYPTGILFSPDGKELARFVGYQSVTQMKSFFSRK